MPAVSCPAKPSSPVDVLPASSVPASPSLFESCRACGATLSIPSPARPRRATHVSPCLPRRAIPRSGRAKPCPVFPRLPCRVWLCPVGPGLAPPAVPLPRLDRPLRVTPSRTIRAMPAVPPTLCPVQPARALLCLPCPSLPSHVLTRQNPEERLPSENCDGASSAQERVLRLY